MQTKLFSTLMFSMLIFALALSIADVRAFAQNSSSPSKAKTSKVKPSVRIESDVMEILQNKNQAIFIGNVIADRGNVRLRAKRLVVHYEKKNENSADKTNKVTRLNATGKVILKSGGRTATGQWAIIHMATNKVIMGDRVIVRENKSIIYGSRLEMDLKTGKNRLFGSSPSRGRGRVLGIFVPK